MAPHPQSVRAVLSDLQAQGALRRIADEVDPRFELSAYLSLLDGADAVLFERLRVFGNLLTSRARIATLLGRGTAPLQDALVAAIRAPRDVRRVEAAPCQEVIVEDPDLAELPVPTFFEHETGPYLTAGAIVARDPQSGKGNLSFARVKPLGGNRAFIGIAPEHHLAVFARRAGNRLPIAVTLGNHPAVLVAGALYLGEGEDELRVASALLPSPLEVVETANGLAVPAHCEMVLEGDLDAGTPVEEGLVSEYHGYYEDYGPGMLVTFSRLTRRHDALLQVVQPGYHAEHVWIGGEAIAASLRHRLGDDAVQVAVTPGGAGRLHAVVAVRDANPGRIIERVWAAVRLIKRVTVVDADVDPWDGRAVELAVATTVRYERDLVLEEAATSRSDPIESAGRVTKLGIDATRKPGVRDWRKAAPPAEVLARVRRKLGLE